MIRTFALYALLLISLCFVCQSDSIAETPKKESDEFFNSGKIIHVHITLDNKSLDSLRREPRKYVKANLKVGDKEYKDVGIHLKGAAGSSRGIDDKPGLTINMNKFGVEQRFYGMDKWHLANSVQDPSYVSELICGELFRTVGVPASRISHAVVTINGKRRGFYYLKEGYDKYFRRHWFENPTGNLYDGGFLRDIDQPLQLLSGSKNGVKNHEDLKALHKAANERDHNVRFQKLEKLLDLDKFISYLCMEVITWDWDGYPMNRNNYRVYHDPVKNKIIFFPSGMDQMFGDPNGTIFPGMHGVARALLETKEGRKRYLTRMEEIMQKHFKVEELHKRLDELQKRLQPALAEVDSGAGRDYPHHINRLKTAIRDRAKSIDNQLKQAKK